jgi:glutathione S-transferase
MNNYIIYGCDYTRSMLTELVFLECEIDYEIRTVNILKEEHLSDEYQITNPTALIPSVLTPQGDILHETAAINLHLAELHQAEHLVPTVNDSDRGVFLSGLFLLTGEIEPALKRYFYPQRYVFTDQDARRMKALSLSQIIKSLNIFENRLKGNGPYYLGKRYSLIDLTLTFWLGYLEGEPGLEDLKSVHKCKRLVNNRSRIIKKFEDFAHMHHQASETKKNRSS